MNGRRIAFVVALGLALGGCLVVPLPWPEEEPRFSAEQVAALVPGTTTRESVAQQLGHPALPEDFVRRGGLYWVYTWRQRGAGRWIAVGPGAAAIPMSDRQTGLFLRFDELGVLQHKELVDRPTADSFDDMRAGMCDAEGVCIERPVGRDAQTGLEKLLEDSGSAFTVPGDLHATRPAPDRCALVLWLDKVEWSTPGKHIKSVYERAPGGINLDYSLDAEAGSTSLTTWLPVGAFAVISLPPGEQAISLRNPWPYLEQKTQTVAFACEAGRASYVMLAPRSKKFGDEFGVIWKELPAELAGVELKGMRQLLFRER